MKNNLFITTKELILILLFLFSTQIGFAQLKHKQIVQDSVTVSYKILKIDGNKRVDRYSAILKAENNNDFDVYYTGPFKTATNTLAANPGFSFFKVENTAHLLSVNYHLLKGVKTVMITNDYQVLYKLRKGEIITADFNFKVKKGKTPIVFNKFINSLKPLDFYTLMPNRINNFYSNVNFSMVKYNRSGNTLPSSEVLYINDGLSSENQLYYLQLQADGNLVVYKKNGYGNKIFIWGTMTNGRGANQLRMQNDGNLVLYNSANVPIWSTKTTGYFDAKYRLRNYKPIMLRLENDGRLILYSSTGKNQWSSSSYNQFAPNSPILKPFPQANFPTVKYDPSGSLLPKNETLLINDCLSSPNRLFYLTLQPDGNLCVYKRNGYKNIAVWCSRSNNKGAKQLRMQEDGNLVLYNYDNVPVWSTNTSRYFNDKYGYSMYKPVKLMLENDGSLVLYSETGNKVWVNK